MENENEKYGIVGIGTKENVSLKPANVKILGFKVEMQRDKNNQEVGEKVSVIVKHPDKPENIGISSVSFKKGKEIKTSGLWFNLDEGLIPKQSALANFLQFLKVKNLNEITGKDVPTELDERGYLTFKAY
jgi:hypothetical protein